MTLPMTKPPLTARRGELNQYYAERLSERLGMTGRRRLPAGAEVFALHGDGQEIADVADNIGCVAIRRTVGQMKTYEVSAGLIIPSLLAAGATSIDAAALDYLRTNAQPNVAQTYVVIESLLVGNLE